MLKMQRHGRVAALAWRPVALLDVTLVSVGISVNYAPYVVNITLSMVCYRLLLFTEKVVMLSRITLVAGVATWAFSPIKYHAYMGILPAFLFLLNMIGVLVAVPALTYFLLPRATLAVKPYGGAEHLSQGEPQ